jgi:hypothetical protein
MRSQSKQRNPVSDTTGSGCAAVMVAAVWATAWTTPAAAKARGPTLQLFPTTVLEDIRETGQVAEDMETGLQDVIARLDRQQQLFVQSKCEGAEEDPGCARISRQLGKTYMEMLEVMSDRLPDMERAVNSTRDSLEKRLRSELGLKMSSWSLQETLLGNEPDGAAPAEPKLRGRSGLRLSERFRQYYTLVAHSGRGADHSLAVVASDIYLDMEEASVLIAQTREEIGRATLLEELNQSFGAVTPEMQAVVDGVKTILFGESGQVVELAGPPPGSLQTEYQSPLEW